MMNTNMRVIVLCGLFTAQSESVVLATPSPRSLHSIATVHGYCDKFIAYDKDVTDRCEDKVINAQYTDGRDSFTFVSTDGVLVVTFSGDGKKQLHQGPDVAVQPLDMILANYKGQVTKITAIGSCKFTNPYKSKATIACDADTKEGQFGGGFTSNGSEPETSTTLPPKPHPMN